MHLAQFVLILWLPIALLLTAMFKPTRAIIIGYTVAWLFLPFDTLYIRSFVYDKMAATSLGILLGAIFLDRLTILRWRPHWVDVPLLAYCLTPVVSAVYNHLGVLAGWEGSFRAFIELGIPWFLGRVYINNLAAVRELAIAIFLAGVVYAPLCLFEVRFSPCLETDVYGVRLSNFDQTIRYNGFRPVVFMQHPLAVAMVMAAASLIGFWLVWTGSLRRIGKLPVWPFVLLVLVTTLACKSVGAIILLGVGLAAIVTPRMLRSYIVIILLLALPSMYCTLRASGVWTGETAVGYIQRFIGANRAKSVAYRLSNETEIANHALQKPLLGWGPGYEFARIDKYDNPAVTDGMWIIALGTDGIIGLTAFLLSFILPCLGFVLLLPTRLWVDPRFSAATGLVVFTAIFGIDCLMNAMLNPNWTLAAGGLGTMTMLMFRQHNELRRQQHLQEMNQRAARIGPRKPPPRKPRRAVVNH